MLVSTRDHREADDHREGSYAPGRRTGDGWTMDGRWTGDGRAMDGGWTGNGQARRQRADGRAGAGNPWLGGQNSHSRRGCSVCPSPVISASFGGLSTYVSSDPLAHLMPSVGHPVAHLASLIVSKEVSATCPQPSWTLCLPTRLHPCTATLPSFTTCPCCPTY